MEGRETVPASAQDVGGSEVEPVAMIEEEEGEEKSPEASTIQKANLGDDAPPLLDEETPSPPDSEKSTVEADTTVEDNHSSSASTRERRRSKSSKKPRRPSGHHPKSRRGMEPQGLYSCPDAATKTPTRKRLLFGRSSSHRSLGERSVTKSPSCHPHVAAAASVVPRRLSLSASSHKLRRRPSAGARSKLPRAPRLSDEDKKKKKKRQSAQPRKRRGGLQRTNSGNSTGSGDQPIIISKSIGPSRKRLPERAALAGALSNRAPTVSVRAASMSHVSTEKLKHLSGQSFRDAFLSPGEKMSKLTLSNGNSNGSSSNKGSNPASPNASARVLAATEDSPPKAGSPKIAAKAPQTRTPRRMSRQQGRENGSNNKPRQRSPRKAPKRGQVSPATSSSSLVPFMSNNNSKPSTKKDAATCRKVTFAEGETNTPKNESAEEQASGESNTKEGEQKDDKV